MKMLILIYVFYASVYYAFGQSSENIEKNENKESKWSIYWQPNSNWDFEQVKYQGIDDFSEHILRSDLRPIDYEPKNVENYSRHLINNFTLINFGVQFNLGQWFAKSEKLSYAIRSGFNYLGPLWSERRTSSYNQILLDSNYNPEFDVIIQKDSLYSDTYYASVGNKVIRWNVDFMVTRQLSERFRFNYGLGAGVTLKYDKKFRIIKSEAAYELVSTSLGNNLIDYHFAPHHNSSKAEIEDEIRDLKDEYGFYGYIPLSLEFILSKKNNVFSRMNLYFEARLGYRWEEDELGDWQNIFLLNHGLGFRFQL